MQSTTSHSIRWTTSDLTIFEGDRVNRHGIVDGELFVTLPGFSCLVSQFFIKLDFKTGEKGL
jgi:hypothetical protein